MTEKSQYESIFIDRPKPHRRGGWLSGGTVYPYPALMETADNGRAIMIENTTTAKLHKALTSYLKKRGYRVHVQKMADGFVAAWTEHLTPPNNGTSPTL